MVRLLLALLCGLTALPTAIVAAQTPTELTEISEARALFIAGRSAFNEGRYEAALDYFNQSFELSGRGVLLFNIAQCLDRLRRDEEAVTAFRRYLQETPDAENRAEVEARIGILSSAIAARSQAPAPVAMTPPAEQVVTPPPDTTAVPAVNPPEAVSPPPVAPPRPFPLGPVITIAGGGVLGVVGGVLMATAAGSKSAVGQITQSDQRTRAEIESDISSAQGRWTAGQVLLVGGLAVAAGGVVWLILDMNDKEEAGVAWLPSPTGLQIAGRF